MLCEVWTAARPCRAQRETVYGACKMLAERIRTFLPRNSVTAAAITDSVLDETGGDERLDWKSILIAPIGSHRGISPCFLAGRSSRLVCNASRAMARYRLVSEGSITSSTKRRPADT